MRTVTILHNCFRSLLERWVSKQGNLWWVISFGKYVVAIRNFVVGSRNCVDFCAVGTFWPNSLDRPAKNASPGCPFFVSGDGRSSCHLLSCRHIPIQQLLRLTIAMQIFTVFRPIKMCDCWAMFLQIKFLCELLHSININNVVMGTNCQHFSIRWELEILDPGFSFVELARELWLNFEFVVDDCDWSFLHSYSDIFLIIRNSNRPSLVLIINISCLSINRQLLSLLVLVEFNAHDLLLFSIRPDS